MKVQEITFFKLPISNDYKNVFIRDTKSGYVEYAFYDSEDFSVDNLLLSLEPGKYKIVLEGENPFYRLTFADGFTSATIDSYSAGEFFIEIQNRLRPDYLSVTVDEYSFTSLTAYRYNDSLLSEHEYKLRLVDDIKRVFENFTVSVGNVKSMNLNDTELSFNIYSPSFNREYNYVSILTDEGRENFFITSSENLNSMGLWSLVAVRDIFFECYLLIDSTVDQFIIADNFESINISGDQVEYNEAIRTPTDYLTSFKKTYIDKSRYRAVWALVTFNEDFFGSRSGLYNPRFQELPYAFIPYCVLDNNDEIVLSQFEFQTSEESVAADNFQLSNINQEYINSIKLVINVPFNVEIIEREGQLYCIASDPNLIWLDSITIDSALIYDGFAIVSAPLQYKDFLYRLESESFISNVDEYVSSSTNVKSNIVEYYPYVRYSIEIGGKEIPLVFPTHLTSVTIRVYPSLHGIYYMIRTTEGLYQDAIHTLEFENNVSNIEFNGSFVLYKDSLDSFRRNNMEVMLENTRHNLALNTIKVGGLLTGTTSKAVGSVGGIVSSAATSNPAGAVASTLSLGGLVFNTVESALTVSENFVHTTNQFNAIITDAKNSVDNISSPTSYSLLNISILDSIRVAKYVPNNYREIEKVKHLLSSNGTIKNVYKKFTHFGINRVFDYVLTSNCEMSRIFNNTYRKVMESIFNGGVRMWRVDNFYGNHIEELKELNDQLNNQDITVYEEILK